VHRAVRFHERFALIRPLEEMELSLVRGAVANPGLVDAHEEAVLRTALSLARLYKVRQEGRDLGVGAWLAPFREELERRLKPVLLPQRGKILRSMLMPHLKELKDRTLKTRDHLLTRFKGRLTFEAVDAELRHKALVLVAGGGGGSGYVYIGVMSLLDEYGLKPKLLVGTSIGAVLSLFRSRLPRFDQDEIVNIVRTLSWRKLFRVISTENRYGLPAALRLFLRAGIGRWFGTDREGAEAVRLKELPIKTIITVSGIRRGKLPHPVEFYEGLFALPRRALRDPIGVARSLQGTFGALAELFTRPEIMVKLHLGADDTTSEWDALDAAGFSCALPGVIHYDVLREDARMHGLIEGAMETHRVSRLVDGGMVDNLPAKAAWRAVHRGQIGTRNAFILALNGFATKLSQPLWLPLARLAEANVSSNRPYAHLVHDFTRTLSPLQLVPSLQDLAVALDLGRKQLTAQVPFLTRMLAPLPRIG
jgi:predicted acylesterase/phospholipase RssA